MENREHFGSLTARMKAFREEVLDEKPYVDAERAILATQAYQENQNQPRVMARALMLKKILEHMTIYIEDKTLLAGNQATKNVNEPRNKQQQTRWQAYRRRAQRQRSTWSRRTQSESRRL